MGAGFCGAENTEAVATAVFVRLDCRGDFQDAVADGVQAVELIRAGEEFSFDDAGVVGDGEEFHRFTGDLVEQALFDDEAAGDDLLAEELSEAVDGAIGFPRDVGIQIERVRADGIAEEFFFGAEPGEAVGFGERARRHARGGREEVELGWQIRRPRAGGRR